MEDNKVLEFNETNETEATNETNNIQVTAVTKVGLRARWNGLKLWQKALILAGGATLVYVGGKYIFKLVEQKPEVVKEVAEALKENPTEVVDETKVVNF